MIGIFDSGIGGLTVVRALRKLDSKLDILYLGDTARTPYGTKSSETIERYALEDAEYLVRAGAKILVVACNTASSVAVPALQKKFPDIPLFEVITPAVTVALAQAPRGRIGVIGTRATIASGIYEQLIKDQKIRMSNVKCQMSNVPTVISKPCPLFVPLVEEGWADKAETKRIAKYYLQTFKVNNIDAIILGCTHYPFLRNVIQRAVGRKIKLIDPADAVAAQVVSYLHQHPETEKTCRGNGMLDIRLTDTTPYFTALAQKWLGIQNIKTKLVRLNDI